MAEEGVNVGEGLTRKLGPLPVWGWIAVAGVGVVAFLYIKGKSGGGGLPAAFQNLPSLGGVSDGGGGGGGGTSSTTPTAATAAQIQAALNSAASATGIPFSEIQRYWQEYLAGEAPVGNTQATGAYNSAINSILGILGTSAPSPAVSTSTNYYTSTNAWLSDIFGVLQVPTGSKLSLSQIENELSQFYAGTISTVSADTLAALQAAIGIYGIGPGANIPGVTPNPTLQSWLAGISGQYQGTTAWAGLLAWLSNQSGTVSQDVLTLWNQLVLLYGLPPGITTGPTLTPSSPTAPAGKTITAGDITSWQTAFFGGTQDFAHWLGTAPSVLASVFNSAQLQQIYNYFAAQSQNGVRYSTDQLVAMINGWLANPSSIPAVPPINKPPTVVPPGTGGH